ncbi:hypothetical protein JW962_03005 [Candidatus Dojkabacteria bacterium]|nr:hypothetical protein [Candidatus Dojkabacteria bacterium]
MKNNITSKEFAAFLTTLAKWTGVFLLICFGYWGLEFLININTTDTKTLVQSFGKATDTFHEVVTILGWTLVIPACCRGLFPKQTRHLGDYLLLGVMLIIFIHAISQLLMGTCIITWIPYILYEKYGVPQVYELYRWNPFGLPSFMVVPYYIAQVILGFYIMWRMYKDIFNGNN